MFVEDVMTAHPVTVTEDATVKEALQLLDTYSVTSLPVVDAAGRIRGVVSEADLIRDRVLPDPGHREVPGRKRPARLPLVGDLCSRLAITVRPHDDLADAVELLTSTAIKSVPVVDRKGVVLGVLSRSDVVHVLARADTLIETGVADVFASLGHTDWLVEVQDGVVDIDGPRTQHERSLARAFATTVAGVVDVRFG